MTTDHQEINETIGTRMRALRISRAVPVARVAEVLGCKKNRVTRIENGTTGMTAAELISVAHVLGVTTSILVGETPANGGDS